jgi:hypothetical protein
MCCPWRARPIYIRLIDYGSILPSCEWYFLAPPSSMIHLRISRASYFDKTYCLLAAML